MNSVAVLSILRMSSQDQDRVACTEPCGVYTEKHSQNFVSYWFRRLDAASPRLV